MAVRGYPRRPFLHRIVAYLHHLHASELRVAALLAFGYGLLELVEGTGLWLDQLWAEYLIGGPVRNLNGRPLPADARDLLSGLGPAGDTITAFPTSNGAVCYMIEGAGSCTNLHKWPWNTIGFTVGIFSTRSGGTRVFGIADTKVTSVNVEIAGVEHPAILGHHAFYYHLPPGVHDSDLQQVTATWNDGSSHTMPLATHWNPRRQQRG